MKLVKEVKKLSAVILKISGGQGMRNAPFSEEVKFGEETFSDISLIQSLAIKGLVARVKIVKFHPYLYAYEKGKKK